MYLNIFCESEEDSFNKYIHIWDDVRGYSKHKYSRYGYMLNEKGSYTTIYGQKCTLVKRWSKEDEEDGLIFESDVNPETRYLIDTYTHNDMPSDKHVVMFLDIEVDTDSGLPNPQYANNTITSIAYYTNTKNEYVVHILDVDGEMQNSKIDKNGEIIKIITHQTETSLLNNFFSEYYKLKPTIISTWNGDNFDIPYIYNRLENLFGSDAGLILSPINIVKFSEFKQRYVIAGVSSLDYMQLYKKLTFGERVSYSLDNISKIELGYGKIKYDGTLNKLYKEDKEKFIEYNVNDVRLIKHLDDKLKFIQLALGICHKGHVPVEDIYYSSRYLDGAILTYLKKHGVVAPNKPKNAIRNGDDDKFSGAYVKDPIPGLYDWVVDLDATSMYPSIIMSLNISPESKIKKIDNFNIELFRKNSEDIVNNTNWPLTYKQLREKLSDEFCISANGVVYKRYKKEFNGKDYEYVDYGVIPTILDKWFKERVEYRKLASENNMIKEKFDFYDRRQHVQKILLNSLYGVLGLPSFRFYDLDNAESVTKTGVELIKFAENSSNFYFKNKVKDDDTSKSHIIYIDTDSLFFSVKELIPDIENKTDEQMSLEILDAAKDMQTFVNNAVNTFSDKYLNLPSDLHRFSFKQELIAKTGFWTTKKRYALRVINDGGKAVDKLKVTGMDVVRSSFPPIFRDFMRQMLSDILDKKDVNYINNTIIELKNNINNASYLDLARPTSVKEMSKYTDNSHSEFMFSRKGTPVHVKAAISYNDFIRDLGLENKYSLIGDNEKIKWVYLAQNKFNIDQLAFKGNDEDPIEIIKFIEENLDREKIFDSEMTGKLQDLYDALGWGNIPTKVNQLFSTFFND